MSKMKVQFYSLNEKILLKKCFKGFIDWRWTFNEQFFDFSCKMGVPKITYFARRLNFKNFKFYGTPWKRWGWMWKGLNCRKDALWRMRLNFKGSQRVGNSLTLGWNVGCLTWVWGFSQIISLLVRDEKMFFLFSFSMGPFPVDVELWKGLGWVRSLPLKSLRDNKNWMLNEKVWGSREILSDDMVGRVQSSAHWLSRNVVLMVRTGCP